jgi:hypothetical protein
MEFRGARPQSPIGRLAIACLCLVGLVAVGVLWSTVADQRAKENRHVPNTARVTCEEGKTTVSDPRVRAQPDGVHVLIDNPVGAATFYMRDANDPGLNQGGDLRRGMVTAVRATFAPGRVLIGCFQRGREAPFNETEVAEFVSLTVLDPQRLWTSYELECGAGREARNIRTGLLPEATPSYESLAYQSVPGLQLGDRLIRPGYPLTEWRGEPRIVVRDSQAIASLGFFQQNGTWVVSVWECPGSGLG